MGSWAFKQARRAPRSSEDHWDGVCMHEANENQKATQIAPTLPAQDEDVMPDLKLCFIINKIFKGFPLIYCYFILGSLGLVLSMFSCCKVMGGIVTRTEAFVFCGYLYYCSSARSESCPCMEAYFCRKFGLV